MTDETDTAEADAAAEEKAFAEAFNPPDPAAATPAAPEPAPATPAEPATPEPSAPAATEPVKEPAKVEPPAPTYTSEQIAALVAKAGEIDTMRGAIDKLSGYVGSMIQDVKVLKAPPAAKAEPEAPAVDDDEFSRDFPDFAAYTQKQIAKATVAGTKTGLSPEDVDARVAAATAALKAELRIELEMERVAETHADWETVLASNGYNLWLAAQPPEVQTVAMKTASARELSKVLTDYKGFVTKQTTAQATAQANKARLERALPPSSVPGARPAEMTEEGAFHAAFAGKL